MNKRKTEKTSIAKKKSFNKEGCEEGQISYFLKQGSIKAVSQPGLNGKNQIKEGLVLLQTNNKGKITSIYQSSANKAKGNYLLFRTDKKGRTSLDSQFSMHPYLTGIQKGKEAERRYSPIKTLLGCALGMLVGTGLTFGIMYDSTAKKNKTKVVCVDNLTQERVKCSNYRK